MSIIYGGTCMPYVERAISPYLKKRAATSKCLRAISPYLKKRAATSKCLLLTGARQVGKSTVIRHVFPEFNRTDFDDRLTRLQAKEEPRLFFLNHPLPLFIDEVQKENSILEEIKRIVDNSEERGQFILSGSCKPELMKGHGTSGTVGQGNKGR